MIRESLRLLHERDQVREIRLEELRKEIHKGLVSSQPELLDIEAIIEEAATEFSSKNRV